MKNHKGKIILAGFVVFLLLAAFFCGDKPSENGLLSDDLKTPTSGGEIISKSSSELLETSAIQTDSEKEDIPHHFPDTNSEKPIKSSDDNSENVLPNENSGETESQSSFYKEPSCTLSVRCDTILNNLTDFNKEKLHLVPEDGIIYAEKTVSFYEGESVFDVLLREMKNNKIHLEFENAPVYNSAYIEGIANIYESDCGSLSGWMYKVNGSFPNYGCSSYKLNPGDRVEWVYTCDRGADVGKNK